MKVLPLHEEILHFPHGQGHFARKLIHNFGGGIRGCWDALMFKIQLIMETTEKKTTKG